MARRRANGHSSDLSGIVEERVAITRRTEIEWLFAEVSRPPFVVCEDPRTVFYGEPAYRDRQWDDYEGVLLGD